jgi:integrase/recombinase XerD
MKKTMRELIAEVLPVMAERGHTQYTIDTYRYLWNSLTRYLDSVDCKYFDLDIANEYLNMRTGKSELTKNYKRFIKRAVLILDSYERTGVVENRYFQRIYLIENEEYIRLLDEYAGFLKKYDYSTHTIENYVSNDMKFLQHLEMAGLYDIARLETMHIYDYVSSLKDYSQVSIKHMTGSLRLFLKYLYRSGYTPHDMSGAFGYVKGSHSLKLPSYWTKDEVTAMLNVIDRGNPNEKRDYAMILLVARLGIRSIDLKELKFENIKWSSNMIEFVQSKTKVLVSLPLLRDVGWAIIDYVENARPPIDSPYVFLTHVAPYRQLSERNHLYKTIEKYMQRAHIPITEKKKSGMHSLRHSLATTLIENNTSLHVISDILGHTSSDSTSRYLQTDIERLRFCALNAGNNEEV